VLNQKVIFTDAVILVTIQCGTLFLLVCCLKIIKIRIYRILILPEVLCGCETWSLTLREKHRLWVFETRVLRRIFGPKRDEVTGGFEVFTAMTMQETVFWDLAPRIFG
jgi:hypothetical protein